MNCFKCNHEIQRSDKFCPNCGKDLRPKLRRQPAQSPEKEPFIGDGVRFHGRTRPEQTSRLAFPNAETDAAYERALQARIAKNRSQRTTLVVALAAVVLVVTYAAGILTGFWPWVAALAVCALLFLPVDSLLLESEYRSLPHAVMDNGRPRCIHCGNKGIYIRGRYKSNLKTHECTRCNRELFVHYE